MKILNILFVLSLFINSNLSKADCIDCINEDKNRALDDIKSITLAIECPHCNKEIMGIDSLGNECSVTIQTIDTNIKPRRIQITYKFKDDLFDSELKIQLKSDFKLHEMNVVSKSWYDNLKHIEPFNELESIYLLNKQSTKFQGYQSNMSGSKRRVAKLVLNPGNLTPKYFQHQEVRDYFFHKTKLTSVVCYFLKEKEDPESLDAITFENQEKFK